MEMILKTPVEITQELLAVHTNRMEAIEKWDVKEARYPVKTKVNSARQQSEQYIDELMSELSSFGDAVKASVDNNNEYQQIYKNALANTGTMGSLEAEQTFQSLEIALANMYQSILNTHTNLPASLRKILSAQLNGLTSK